MTLATGACSGDPTDLPDLAATPGVALDTIATGLEVPWDIDFAPDGRIFFTERPGRIRVIEGGAVRPEPWAVLPIAERGEIGLMGIALAPDFATSGHLYVVGAFENDEGDTEDRIYRFTEEAGAGTDQQLIADGLPAARFHAGAALDFGPDGMLYVTVGDALRPGDSRDAESVAAKILRLTPDGGIPPDNPIPGSPVYALGIRNSQGIDWHPDTGDLFSVEHGPSGLPTERFRTGRDELNAIVPGEDYGWPEAAGIGGGGQYIQPLVAWTPTEAPSGMAFYRGDVFDWRGDVIVAALRGGRLIRVELEPAPRQRSGWRAVGQESLFEGELGRLRAVVSSPDGEIYFSTSNRDGRGNARAGDDMILKIVRR